MPMETELLHIQNSSDMRDITAIDRNRSEALEELRREVVHGFLYSHTRANDNTGKALEVASFFDELIEQLIVQ
jgi:hypothetical protein